MRICLIGRYNETELFRGPEKVARRIADEFAAMGHRVFFYEYFFSGESYGYWMKLFGSERVKNSDSLSIFRVGVFPFMLAMLNKQYDIIHIITFERFAIPVFLLKPFIKTPIVYSVHGIVQHQHTNFGSTVKKSLTTKDRISEFLFFKFSDILFFLSARSVSIASQYYKVPKEKVAIVANGVDDIFYGIKKQKQGRRTGVTAVFVGDPKRPEKGFDFFLHAIEHCRRRAKVFVICETVPVALVSTMNGVDINFVQKMETQQYVEFLANIDIYVSASSYDQFSIAAAEAMGAGLVPVVTKETGMSRYVDHGVNGFIIEFGNIRQLSQTLDLLIADSRLRKKLSLNARSAISQLSWRSVAEEYLRRYGVE